MTRKQREMHPSAKDSIVDQLVRIAEGIADPESDGGHMYNFHDIEIRLDISRSLHNECKIVAKRILHEHNWEDTVSEKTILAGLIKHIAKILKSDTLTKDQAVLQLEALIAEVKASLQARTTYIPLVGIDMQVDVLQLGNVTIATMTDAEYAELLSRTKIEDSESERDFESTFKRSVCAKVLVRSEADKAQERAETECRIALDLLRYAALSIYPERLKISVGILGEARSGLGIRSILTTSSDTQETTYSRRVIRPDFSFVIKREHIEVMENIGVFEAAAITTKPAKTEFEKALLDAIHWFTNVQVEMEAQYKLLSMIIALETLFIPKGRSLIGATIAEGVAFLIGHDRDSRKFVRSEIIRLYHHRSDVAHGGDSGVSAQDLEYLRYVVGTVIVQLIKRRDEFTDKQSLVNWLIDQEMTGVIPPPPDKSLDSSQQE